MSLPRLLVALSLIAGCGGGSSPAGTQEPQNAREKQLQEAKAKGEVDATGDKSWGKWRYTGDRGECFYELNGRCFKTQKKACAAAACKAPKKCATDGAGPATVSCK